MNVRMISAIALFLILVLGGITAGQEEPMSAVAIFVDVPSILIVVGIVMA